jgi:hypothetical protein
MLRGLGRIRTALFASPHIYRSIREQQHQIYNLSLLRFGARLILSRFSTAYLLPFPSTADLLLIRLPSLKQC